jgi:hypothetical protein
MLTDVEQSTKPNTSNSKESTIMLNEALANNYLPVDESRVIYRFGKKVLTIPQVLPTRSARDKPVVLRLPGLSMLHLKRTVSIADIKANDDTQVAKIK